MEMSADPVCYMTSFTFPTRNRGIAVKPVYCTSLEARSAGQWCLYEWRSSWVYVDRLSALIIVQVIIAGYRTPVLASLSSVQRCRANRSRRLLCPAVEHRSLADVLSLSCVRLVADGW